MISLYIQTFLLIAIAFILGCVIGALLRGWFGTAKNVAVDDEDKDSKPKQVEPKAAPSVDDEMKPQVQKQQPKVPKPPTPSEPVTPVEKPIIAQKTVSAVASPQKVKPAKKVTAKTEKVISAGKTTSPDNLKLIRGIGPQNEVKLNKLGINSFRQIARWTAEDEEKFGDALAFPGRIEREEWVKQASIFENGGSTEFSKRVKSGDVLSSTGGAPDTELGTKPGTLLANARGGKPDALTTVGGVGNAIEKKLFKMGIYHFDQIAELNADELVWLGHAVGFPGRPARENWSGEAKVLMVEGASTSPTPAKRGTIKGK